MNAMSTHLTEHRPSRRVNAKSCALCPLFGRWCRERYYTYSWLNVRISFFFVAVVVFFSRDLASVGPLSLVCYNDDDNDAMQSTSTENDDVNRGPVSEFVSRCIVEYSFYFRKRKKRRSRITQWGQKTASNEFISLLRTDLFQRLLQLEFT